MKPQEIQEEQYALPYHYLPQINDGDFRQHDYWSWGFRYLGGLHVARTLCDEEDYASLLDLGCGDGRFLSELAKQPDKELRLMGVDYSERAISIAKALNPTIDYRHANIISDDVDTEAFDVLTLVEVIEHIPPDELEIFVERAIEKLKPGGRLVLTVPHRNSPTNPKHFQHFDSGMLRELLEGRLEDLKLVPFDFFSRFLDIWFRLLGRTGKYFLVTWQPLLNAFYRYYINNCLLGGDESRCRRIACVGRKPGKL